MKHIELASKIATETDKGIYNLVADDSVNKREIETMLLSVFTVGNLTSEEKIFMKDRIRMFDDDSFGALATYIYFIPIFEQVYSNKPQVDEVTSAMYTDILNYCLGEIHKGIFVQQLWKVQKMLGVSDEFFDSLLDYFATYRKEVTENLIIAI
ncbi:MAG: hypothetical protein RR912_06270 [Clostridium sp.]